MITRYKTNEENAELQNGNYSPSEYADYLFQFEKVLVIHAELIDKSIFLEEAYTELNQDAENETK